MTFSRYRLYQKATKIRSSSRRSIGVIHLDSAVYIVAKAMLENPYAIFNEMLAVDLASLLRIPVADGLPLSGFSTIAEPKITKETLFWGSVSVGDELPVADCEAIVNDIEQTAVGLIVFDAWIVNSDRNELNLTYRVDSKQMIAFDHEMAICGSSGISHLHANNGLSFLDGHALAYHLTSLRFVSYWIERLYGIHDEQIWGAVSRHSHMLPDPTKYNEIAKELIIRKRMLAYWFHQLQKEKDKSVFPCLKDGLIQLPDVCLAQPQKLVVEIPNDSSFSI